MKVSKIHFTNTFAIFHSNCNIKYLYCLLYLLRNALQLTIKVLFVITHKKSLRGIYFYFDIWDINLPIFISFSGQFFFQKYFCNVMPLVLERNLCESALFWQPVSLNYSCWIFAKKLLYVRVEKLTKLLNSIFYFWEANSQWSKFHFICKVFAV